MPVFKSATRATVHPLVEKVDMQKCGQKLVVPRERTGKLYVRYTYTPSLSNTAESGLVKLFTKNSILKAVGFVALKEEQILATKQHSKKHRYLSFQTASSNVEYSPFSFVTRTTFNAHVPESHASGHVGLNTRPQWNDANFLHYHRVGEIHQIQVQLLQRKGKT